MRIIRTPRGGPDGPGPAAGRDLSMEAAAFLGVICFALNLLALRIRSRSALLVFFSSSIGGEVGNSAAILSFMSGVGGTGGCPVNT